MGDSLTLIETLRPPSNVFVAYDGRAHHDRLGSRDLRELDAWLEHFRGFWTHRLDALATEVARGKRARGRSTSAKRRRRKQG